MVPTAASASAAPICAARGWPDYPRAPCDQTGRRGSPAPSRPRWPGCQSSGVLRHVAGAQQVQPRDAAALTGIGVDLLLHDEPAGAKSLRPQPQPPLQVQPATDLADDGLDKVEVLCVAEPACEPAGDHLCARPLPQAPGQQRAQPGISSEHVTEPGEVLNRQALQE